MKLVVCFLFLMSALHLRSQQFGKFEFTGAGVCPNSFTSVTVQPENAAFSFFSSQGVNCTPTNDVYNNSGWNTTAIIDLNEFNQFSIVAEPCFSLHLTSITFSHRISNVSSPPTWHLRSNVDNFSSDISSGSSSVSISSVTVDLSTSHANLNQVIFRLYLTNVTANSTTWRNDNVSVSGYVSEITPTTYFLDADSDTFGDPNSSLEECSMPLGYVVNNLDCNDANANIHPNTIWFLDQDADGFGNSTVRSIGCFIGENFVLDSTDCDDLDPDFSIAIDTFYRDTDLDGFGDSSIFTVNCFSPTGFVSNFLDCDDNNPMVYFSASDTSENGVDENCDGVDGFLETKEHRAVNLHFYPNPAKDWITLEVSDQSFKEFSISIVDVKGMEVLKSEDVAVINLSNLQGGLYFLTLRTVGTVFMTRILIQK
jgi:hypothetical protein